MGHFGDGFYGLNDPTNSVKALKEVVVLRTGFSPTRSTSPCYNPITHACNTQWYTIQKWNMSTVKWAQWDKTQSKELLVCSCVCALHCAQLLHTILHRTDLIVFPLTPPPKQSPLLRWCLFEGREEYRPWWLPKRYTPSSYQSHCRTRRNWRVS